jgi:hypothetical protein
MVIGPEINDNGGTRSGADRRQFSNKGYTPERRSGRDRRGGIDRRSKKSIRDGKAIERREAFIIGYKKSC